MKDEPGRIARVTPPTGRPGSGPRHETDGGAATVAARAARVAALPVPAQRPAGGGVFRSLRHRDYRLFWIGLGLALTGFQVQRVALGFLAYQLTGSALYLALVFGGDSIPMMVLSPLGGVAVDRVNRRLLLILTRSGLAALALTVSVLIVGGWIAAWHLLAFTLITGVLYAFDIPTRQAAIRDLVPEADFFNAVALSSTVMQASRIVGPAVGGAALVAVGAGGAMALMAAGNAGMAAMVALTRLPHTPVPRTQSALANLRDGLRFIARNEHIWTLMVVSAVGAVFAMTYQSLTPVFAEDVLGEGKAAIGVMLTAAGIGALAGSTSVAAHGERLGRPVLSAGAAIGFGLLVVLFALSRSYPLSLALLVAAGAVGAVYSVVNSTIVQAQTPREMQGRVMGVYQMTWNVQLLGALATGALADRVGAPAALACAGLATSGAVALLLLLRPSLRR
jgi:MFS family permease